MDTTGLLADWLADPAPTILTLVFCALVGYLYWRGARYAQRTGIGRPVRALQAIALYAALLVLLLAVASPFDALADRSFAAHMAQHAALILIVAPLALLGDPFLRLWRALPLSWRRVSLRWLMQRRRVRHLWSAVEALMRRPAVTLIAFLAVFMLWHLPALYQLALRVEVIHGFEHACFLGVALLFWAQVIPSFPLRPRMSYIKRVGYLFVAGIALHLFSILIALAQQPIYSYYASNPTAIADQQAAGAMMDISGMIIFTIALLVFLGLWLLDEDRKGAAATVPVMALPETSAGGTLLLIESEQQELASADLPSREG